MVIPAEITRWLFAFPVAFFCLFSLVSGVMAARNSSSLWIRLFWITLLLFLVASSLFLLSIAPSWIALAPAIPALIILTIQNRSGPTPRNGDGRCG
ncbi:MAG: hypothetical protein Q7I97_08965 [Thermovirgaceae bacterium]|nr:hypothetical protein [Thermovirgaceae bacterium]